MREAGGTMDMESRQVDRRELVRVILDAEDHTVIPLLVTGSSMAPMLLDRRSVVYLERNRAYVPRRGDILLFCRPDGTVVLHRLVKCLEDGQLLINGDAQAWTETIFPEQIVARVVRFRRKRRERSVEGLGYRLYVRLWMPLRPLHPKIWRFLFLCSRVPHKLGLVRKQS